MVGSAFVSVPLLWTLAVVGFLDDFKNLPASWRYLVQLVAAFFLLGVSPLVQRLAFCSSGSFLLPVTVLLLIGVTAVINFTNFMDGLDGLVAGCMTVHCCLICFY